MKRYQVTYKLRNGNTKHKRYFRARNLTSAQNKTKRWAGKKFIIISVKLVR